MWFIGSLRWWKGNSKVLYSCQENKPGKHVDDLGVEGMGKCNENNKGHVFWQGIYDSKTLYYLNKLAQPCLNALFSLSTFHIPEENQCLQVPHHIRLTTFPTWAD
jgi:hypothetical protein